MLSLRKGDYTLFSRMDAMKKQELYYTTLKSVLIENNLMDKPGQIYNFYESGMPLEHCSPRALAKKGNKR